jgi:hypothetical protein
MVKVKTWNMTVERDGKICRLQIYAPNKRLAVLNYRHDVSYRDVILKISVSRKNH